jgi:hypothetical protein
MTILESVRDLLPSRTITNGATGVATERGADLPFEGYDHGDLRELVQGLSDHSQVELEAVETYERAHKGREAVLDKLRYLRGPEPLPGYDALTVDEILAVVKDADLATVKRVRGYERKFGKRSDLLDQVVRTQRALHESLPEEDAPTYAPQSAEKDHSTA